MSPQKNSKVLLSGASGLIGSALQEALSSQGYSVFTLVRRAPRSASEIEWDPYARRIDRKALEGFGTFIHLSGETVAQRWTPATKQRLVDSRIKTTQFLAETITSLTDKPSAFLCASAIGIYGTAADDPRSEDSSLGSGFLADLCRQWEAAANIARTPQTKVCHMRISVVLSPKGGMLKVLLPLFRLGLGGRAGSGAQVLSWISLEDIVRAIAYLVEHPVDGAVNLAAPHPETNASFAKKLASALHRPAPLPAPQFAIELAMGKEMARGTALSSTNALPKWLLDAGFTWKHPTAEKYFESEFAQRNS